MLTTTSLLSRRMLVAIPSIFAGSLLLGAIGIGCVALSISHEREFAVAVAYAMRTKGGRFVYPPGVAEQLGLPVESGS